MTTLYFTERLTPALLCSSRAADRYLSSRSGLSCYRGSRFHKCRLMNWAVFDRAGAWLAVGSIKPETGLTIRELISREVR